MSSYRKKTRDRRNEQHKAYYARSSNTATSRIKALLRASTVDRSALSFDFVWRRLERTNFCCEITGEQFTWGPREPTSLSIDRINPAKGYTEDNIRLVCWWVNAAMGNWGLDRLKKLIRKWVYRVETAG